MAASSLLVDVNPLDRIGQVSALAKLQSYFLIGSLAMIATVVLCARRGGAAREWGVRVACAGFAGLTSGFVAAGVAVALHGTPWGLNAKFGDAGQLFDWSHLVLLGDAPPNHYPPTIVYLLAAGRAITSVPIPYVYKFVQLAGVALTGPLAYLSWRLHLRPGWALGIGVVAALPLLQPYKPYEYLVLIVLVPVIVKFLRVLRGCAVSTYRSTVLAGLAFGITFGLLFQTYSGWFLWSAPGAVGATLVFLPWRTGGLRRAMALLGTTGAAFVGSASPHLFGVVSAMVSGAINDSYFYFDVYVDPAYVAMWRDDLLTPGLAGWPPPGELGEVGLFTALLALGAGVAVALGGRRPLVVGVGAVALGAWLMRFWIAGRMYDTQSVQLYPRTTAEVLYCLLLLSGFAIYFGVRRLSGLLSSRAALGTVPDAPGARISLAPVVGALCGLMLLFGSAASATSDKFMPNRHHTVGFLAWTAHATELLNGECAEIAPRNTCTSTTPQPN